MQLKIKEKGWLFNLLVPKSFTLVGDTLYYPPGKLPSETVMLHELVHVQQMEEVGKLKFWFLYLFCFPILWNPWRKRWETEAYLKAQKYKQDKIDKRLNTRLYGWLK